MCVMGARHGLGLDRQVLQTLRQCQCGCRFQFMAQDNKVNMLDEKRKKLEAGKLKVAADGYIFDPKAKKRSKYGKGRVGMALVETNCQNPFFSRQCVCVCVVCVYVGRAGCRVCVLTFRNHPVTELSSSLCSLLQASGSARLPEA